MTVFSKKCIDYQYQQSCLQTRRKRVFYCLRKILNMNAGAFKKGEKRENQGKRGPNKMTKELKEMILGALSDAGGQDYLTRQAEDNPTAFLTLVGKVLPMTIKGEGKDGEIVVRWLK